MTKKICKIIVPELIISDQEILGDFLLQSSCKSHMSYIHNTRTFGLIMKISYCTFLILCYKAILCIPLEFLLAVCVMLAE